VRVLALDTSSPRGSVALLEWRAPNQSVLTLSCEHAEVNRHGERILPLVEELLNEAGWPRDSLDRIGVGVGPGSFTGLRVGIALAQGLALGLDVPLVGVGSLRSMAAAIPQDDTRTRVAILDARRDEYFIAAYDAVGKEVLAPRTIAQAVGIAGIETAVGTTDFVIAGQASPEDSRRVALAHADLPHATQTAHLTVHLDPAVDLPSPLYIRGANAIRPDLPPSPLSGR
jgi:tRNA threonylcarbamoyladenosine biosynthesis protein TsaB